MVCKRQSETKWGRHREQEAHESISIRRRTAAGQHQSASLNGLNVGRDFAQLAVTCLKSNMTSAVPEKIQEIAKQAQQGVLNDIPEKWRLKPAQLDLAEDANVMNVPLTCGILTPEQIAITEQTATQLLSKLATRQLSSVDVVGAFCARAAIAHQLVITQAFIDRSIIDNFTDKLHNGVLSE